MVQDDLEKIWKRLRPFRLSPQRSVSATRSSDRELRPRSPAVLAGVQTKHGVLFVEGGPSTQPYARGPLRPPRDISMPRARARATPNARARLVSFAPLPHPLPPAARCAAAGSNEPPPPSRLAPQAGPSLSPPASSRRRLARSRPRPASSRRRLASRRAFALLASRRRRQPVFSHSRRRGRQVSEAGIEPSARVVRTTAPQARASGGVRGGAAARAQILATRAARSSQVSQRSRRRVVRIRMIPRARALEVRRIARARIAEFARSASARARNPHVPRTPRASGYAKASCARRDIRHIGQKFASLQRARGARAAASGRAVGRAFVVG